MDEAEINAVKIAFATRQGADLVWRDVDGGIHRVIGFKNSYRMDPEDEPEPVVMLKDGHAALSNVEACQFYYLTPLFPPHEGKQ